MWKHLGWWQHCKNIFKGNDLLCVWFHMQRVPICMNYIRIEWVFQTRMKGKCESMVIWSFSWNSVIHKDPFCGHFMEPYSDLKCTGANIVDHILAIPRLLVVIIVMLCLLDSVVHKTCYYCWMFIRQ